MGGLVYHTREAAVRPSSSTMTVLDDVAIDDWSCLIGEFECGATGVWEGTTLAKGYHRDGFGHEWAEINGSEGSAVYRLHEPNTILLGRTGHDLEPVPVPAEFLKPAGSPRDLIKTPSIRACKGSSNGIPGRGTNTLFRSSGSWHQRL